MKDRSINDILEMMGEILAQLNNLPSLGNVDILMRLGAEVYEEENGTFSYIIYLSLELQPLFSPLDIKILNELEEIIENYGFRISKIDSSNGSISLYLYYETGRKSI